MNLKAIEANLKWNPYSKYNDTAEWFTNELMQPMPIINSIKNPGTPNKWIISNSDDNADIKDNNGVIDDNYHNPKNN